jgi:hypothetical protein
MDWPVIGSIAGVTALGASVALGGWLVLESRPMATNGPAAPVLLVDTSPRQPSPVSTASQQRRAEQVPMLAPTPRTELASLPLSEPEKPLRLSRPSHHIVADAPKKSVLVRPRVETTTPHPQQKPPAIVDERYAQVLTPDKVGQLRHMLHLRADQQEHWPPVDAMLRQIGRVQMAHIRRGEKPEVDSGVMMQLYSAAQPLLASLLPDQKEKIRSLARSLGYPNVASLL